ncbi:adenylyltransferase/cytidyltransferase family protein [Candidatus Woesearchaeota archaeon]|nr:adenylyltransferase/cytidyltransferase family protein [Candidatus Woesearchaeota archaeon]
MVYGNIITLNELVKIVNNLKKQNKKIITTNGVFDILHRGHIDLFKQAKKLGGILIVGVNSDGSVKQNKGDKRPINNEKSRLEVVSSMKYVDYVFLFDEKDPRKWLSKIKPNIHIKGSDYTIESIIEKDVVESNSGKIVLIPIVEGYSTTDIIGRILSVYKKG